MAYPHEERQTESRDCYRGRTRPSMYTNFLLQKNSIGKGTKFLFAQTPPNKTFGVVAVKALEGAREVTMNWKEQRPDAKTPPGPDFRAMNKRASDWGLTSSIGQQEFRKAHPIALKQGRTRQASGPVKPPNFVYGRPSTHKTMEEVRMSGKEAHIDIGTLIQGAYADDWIKSMQNKDFRQASRHNTPRATKASMGHSLGAQERLLLTQPRPVEPFKMARFKSVKPKTLTRRCVSDATPELQLSSSASNEKAFLGMQTA